MRNEILRRQVHDVSPEVQKKRRETNAPIREIVQGLFGEYKGYSQKGRDIRRFMLVNGVHLQVERKLGDEANPNSPCTIGITVGPYEVPPTHVNKLHYLFNQHGDIFRAEVREDEQDKEKERRVRYRVVEPEEAKALKKFLENRNDPFHRDSFFSVFPYRFPLVEVQPESPTLKAYKELKAACDKKHDLTRRQVTVIDQEKPALIKRMNEMLGVSGVQLFEIDYVNDGDVAYVIRPFCDREHWIEVNQYMCAQRGNLDKSQYKPDIEMTQLHTSDMSRLARLIKISRGV